MRTIAIRLLAGILTSILVCGICAAQPDTLTIIHVNDTHSNLDTFGAGKYGGIARAASVIGQWKMTEPNPILLHAGDLFVGNLMFNVYFGIAELMILNQLGFDALVLGNHEFDAGPHYLAGALSESGINASFHILGSNVRNCETNPWLNTIIKSRAIKDIGSVKVGFVGVTTPAANIESNPSPLYIDDNIVEITMEQVAAVREEGAEVVIVVTHLGIAYDMQLAEWLSGVDAIVGGHSHTATNEVVYVNGIPIVQAGSYYRYVGKLSLIYDGGSTTVHEFTLQEVTDQIPAEPMIAQIVDELKLDIQKAYYYTLGNVYDPISIADRHFHSKPSSLDTLDTPTGNLVTAAMLAYVDGADCALEPKGHIVEDIYEGAVTTADLFRVYPYGYDPSDGLGFRLASYKLYGAHIAGVLDALLQLIHPEIDDYEYLMQSAGLQYNLMYRDDELTIAGITIGGEPIVPEQLYTVVSSDQVAGYLVNLFGIEPIDLVVHPVSVIQVVKEYAEQFSTLPYSMGKNIVVSVQETGAPSLPGDFYLGQNYPNPCNPTSVIEFTVPGYGPVSMKLYDLLGREVATLVHEELPAGRYTVDVHAENLSSGTYFYQLRAGFYCSTKKLVVLK